MNEELKVVITVEGQKATKQMKEFGKTTDSVDGKQKKMKKTLGDVKAGWLGATAAIAGGIAVIKKVSDAVQKYISAASSAEEVSSKFAVTFGDMSATAERAATTLAESYGLAESTAKELMSATGDMLSGFGATDKQALQLSTKVQQLAVDLASFTNYSGGAKGAADALTKGLLGEREMMKSLGIAIGEADVKQRLLEKGQQDLEGTALKMARAEATLELAYEQSENAIGDYERTMESYANVARRSEEVTKALREEMGKRLTPVAGTLKSKITEIKEEMYLLIKANNDLQTALGKVAKGEVLDYSDQIALAKQETTELNKQMMAISQGKISVSGLKAVFGNIFNIKKVSKELADEQERSVEAVEKLYEDIRAGESLTDTWLKKEKEKEAVIGRQEQYEKIITDELRAQKAIVENEYKAAWAEVEHIIEGSKGEIEQIQDKIDYLNEYPWEPGGEYEIARKEAIKILEAKIEMIKKNEELNDGVNRLTQSYEGWRAAMDNARVASKVLEDRTFAGLKKVNEGLDETSQKILSVFDIAMPVFEDIGTALTDNAKGWESVAQTAIQAVAEIIRALGKEAAVQAAIAYANPLTIPQAIAYTAASVIAFTAAGIVEGFANNVGSAAEGADFVTSGPQMMMVGDNPGGRERVSVTPLSSPNVAGPRGGGVTIAINAPVYGVNDLYYKLKSAGNTLSRRGRG